MKVRFKKKETNLDRQKFLMRAMVVGVVGFALCTSTGAFNPDVIQASMVKKEVTTETEEVNSSEDEIVSTTYDFDWEKLTNIPVPTTQKTEASDATSRLLQMRSLENPLNTSYETNINADNIASLFHVTTVETEETVVEPVVEEVTPVIYAPEPEVEETEAPTEEVVEETEVQTSRVIHVGEEETEATEEEVVEETVEETEATPEEPRLLLNLSAEEKEMLCRITEAEVTGSASELARYKGCSEEDIIMCKFHVARVIVNRVISGSFPNSIRGVVFQSRQFSPISDGRYYKVHITDATREAVERALNANIKDAVDGALYFRSDRGTWKKLTYLFKDQVGHKFYAQ